VTKRRRDFRVLGTVFILVLLMLWLAPLALCGEKPKKVIIVQWAVLATYRSAEKHFEEELRSLAQKNNIAVEVESFNAYGDKKALDEFLQKQREGGVDLAVTIGNIATSEARKSLPSTPIVFLEVLCPDLLISKAPEARTAVITGTSPDLDFFFCLKRVKERFPDLQRIGVIYTTAQEIPEAQAGKLKKAAAALGMEVVEEKLEVGFCRNEADVKMALQKLFEKHAPQALWVLDDGNINRFLNAAIEYCKTKSVRLIGPPLILKKGGDVACDVDRVKLSRQAAEQAITLLRGITTKPIDYIYDPVPQVLFSAGSASSR
jgi:ABC-type uncharacterized transport system substrate-binding protein